MTVSPWAGALWTPRDWQSRALPHIGQAMRDGKRAIVSAATGSGKSILLTEVAYLHSAVAQPDEVVVVSTPTQSLVKQLAETIAARAGAKNVGMYYGRRKQAGRIVVTCNPSLGALDADLATRGRRVRLLIADECHGTEAETLKVAIPALDPRWTLGFTATPFRSVATESLSLWDDICFRYTLGDALRDKVVVPWRTVNWDGRGNSSTNDLCIELIKAHGRGPGIVSAMNVQDAESYADKLTAAGVPAMAIHGYLPESEQTSRIERLLAGEFRALVHVQLLTEGVDIPPLRWLCMRRPVGARVRFIQELGRVIRAWEGKDHAVVMDPHDLFGAFGVATEPKLGELEQLDRQLESMERNREGGGGSKPVELPPAKAIDVATRWSRQLLIAMQAEGLAAADAIKVDHWRTRRPSDRQIKTLVKMGRTFARHLPDEHRHAVLALSREAVARKLQRGAVSDLIDILSAVADAAPSHWQQRSGWKLPWPSALVIEPLQDQALKAVA